MKTSRLNRFAGIFLALTVTTGVAVSSNNYKKECSKRTNSEIDFANQNSDLIQEQNNLNTKTDLLFLADDNPGLLAEEKSGILLMREEEKMARDVYGYFYDKWNLNVFQNIRSSENNHYNAVYSLINMYELEDPSTEVTGTFTNATITELYARLIKAGSSSVQEALKAGAFIEEYDILDLERLLAETKNSDIQRVYGNLLRASRNHLRAFVSVLKTYEVEYTPELMKTADFTSIIESSTERGNPNGQHMRNINKNCKKKGNRKGRGNT